MEKNLYIDASHPNQTKIVLKSEKFIEEYEFEDKNNLTFKKNNIYLGTISRVEPSLQAAFVNFGKIDMVLTFNDIQSDYYQIPSEDKEKIKIAEERIREKLRIKNIENSQENSDVSNTISEIDLNKNAK